MDVKVYRKTFSHMPLCQLKNEASKLYLRFINRGLTVYDVVLVDWTVKNNHIDIVWSK